MGPRLTMRRPPLFTFALLAALAIVTLWWQLAEKRARTEAATAALATGRANALEDSLRAARLVRGTAPGPDAATPASSDWLRSLRARGLRDPQAQLATSLADHPELIPFKGELGGTMAFHDRSSVVLLDGPWVYAQFDDGHSLGDGIFEYQVAPGGRITWKRLAARMDD